MANNRLYIVDQDGKRFLLATSFGGGWHLFTPWSEERFNEWMEERDRAASYGDCFRGKTGLRLQADNDDNTD